MKTDTMVPIPFATILSRIVEEYNNQKTIFGIRKMYTADQNKTLSIFGEKLETPFGPAAGPHTQLAQNIVSSYICGSRFFELKTVQILDGEDLPVSKPCITAGDEAYNCEWSTELYVPEAFEEYVKGWFLLNILSKELGLGNKDGFVFNMSVGYDLEGIKTPKIDNFIEGLKDASKTEIFAECKKVCLEMVKEGKFTNVTEADVEAIRSDICRSITLSTLHGCPPQEIERIAHYLLTEKKVHTFIKCNPTLLGYDFARKTLDGLGFDYIAFDDHHFKADLQMADALPMLDRLQAIADEKDLSFGVKITNTFPVDVKGQELPSEEMYMSGRSLAPLSLNVAQQLTEAKNGKLRISYSGGADINNIEDIYGVGILPITIATSVLKPGGYERFVQIANTIDKVDYADFAGINVAALTKLAKEATVGNSFSSNAKGMYKKSVKPAKSRKLNKKVPLFDCFTASCGETCPINQDIPAYIRLNEEGRFAEALDVIIDKNPLPFITGTICSHPCMSKCTRTFYEGSVNIRGEKLIAATSAYDSAIESVKKIAREVSKKDGIKLAIIGAGPAGLSAAYFASRVGIDTSVFEKQATCGGIVQTVIPNFRIDTGAIQKDVELVKAMGAKVTTGVTITSVQELLDKGFTHVIVALGAWGKARLDLPGTTAVDALDFLADFKQVELGNGSHKALIEKYGDEIIIIGGGNTAMDTARAAKRINGVKNVKLVYRRTKRYMPADEEELELAIEDGVDFCELLSPESYNDGKLICSVMELSEVDASGRRGVKATGKTVEIAATSIVAATGSTLDTAFYAANNIACNEKGYPVVSDAFESSIANVFVVGDGAKGPATVVEAIANATKAVNAIAHNERKAKYTLVNINKDTRAPLVKKGLLSVGQTALTEGKRCLECSTVCELCCDVCPNRANVAVMLNGKSQIIHIDSYCNECGNCSIFCPYSSEPYKDKFTLFSSKEAFDISTNNGFTIISEGEVFVRLAGIEYTTPLTAISSELYNAENGDFALALINEIWYNKSFLLK